MKIKQYFDYVHLSAGDLLRAELKRTDSVFAKQIADNLKIGKILPVQITCTLLENAMNQSGKDTFLIDGFPRNKDNLDGWNRQMGLKANVKGVLFFECPNDVNLFYVLIIDSNVILLFLILKYRYVYKDV